MVVVRMRPFNTKEKNEKRGPCIELDCKRKTVSITLMTDGKAAGPPNVYTYDSVHGEDTIQIDFYNTACRGLVNAVLSGFNGTIFAYGQTGCGKTWTMQGVLTVPELRGVIPNSFDHIFEHVHSKPSTKFLVRCSYLEIYNEEVRDLLGTDTKARLQLKEHPDRGVFVDGLKEEVVNDVDTMNEVMERGEKHRTVGATAMNAGSSRSHSIYSVVIEEYGEGDDGKDHLRAGKLNLVDLAGSETVAKTGATGDRMKEGVNINKSLSALGNVISALVEGKGKHIPYRDSKLTRLLQSSLGGNTKTLMMAAISPADYNYNEVNICSCSWSVLHRHSVRLFLTLHCPRSRCNRRCRRCGMLRARRTSRTRPRSTRTPKTRCCASTRRRLSGSRPCLRRPTGACYRRRPTRLPWRRAQTRPSRLPCPRRSARCRRTT